MDAVGPRTEPETAIARHHDAAPIGIHAVQPLPESVWRLRRHPVGGGKGVLSAFDLIGLHLDDRCFGQDSCAIRSDATMRDQHCSEFPVKLGSR